MRLVPFLPKQTKRQPAPRADPLFQAIAPNEVCLFGGISEAGIFNDCWVARLNEDASCLVWEELAIQGLPKLLSFASTSAGEFLYIYGGQTMSPDYGTVTVGDLYRISPRERTCVRLQQKGELPGPRNSSSLCFWPDKNCLILSGGSDEQMTSFEGVWLFFLESSEWQHSAVKGLGHYATGLWSHSSLVSQTQFRPSGLKDKHAAVLVEVLSREDVEEVMIEAKGPYLTIVGGCSDPSAVYPLLTQVSLLDMAVVTVRRVAPACSHRSRTHGQSIVRLGGMDGSKCVPSAAILASGEEVVLESRRAVGMGTVLIGDSLLTFGGGDQEGFLGLEGYRISH